MGITLPKIEFEKIKSHGKDSYPQECCGVLIGDIKNGQILVDEARRMRNTNEGSRNIRYNIDPFDLIKLEDELDVDGRVMIGIYHSHPNHPARPSETDLKFAWPNLSYIVLSVNNGQAENITSWKLNDNFSEKEFIEQQITLE